MEKEFCTYTQALALKELGFDYEIEFYKDNLEDIFDMRTPNDAPCILWQQAFRWFREKYNRLHTVNIDLSNNLKDKVFVYTIEDHLGSIVDRSEEYKTYEEAESACLYELIKTVKNK